MPAPRVTKVPWIGTSWKMNKLRRDALAFAAALKASPLARSPSAKPFVIPPHPYVYDVAEILKGTGVQVGAQNMHWEDHGAWTGEISPLMVRDCGASLVEIGHSERRTFFNETDDTVALKVKAALRNGLLALVCIGDTRKEFDGGQTADALERQVRAALRHAARITPEQVMFAYEPVWSIGDGGVPAHPDFANEQHARIKALAKDMTGMDIPVLYGGSVNLANCVQLATQSHIDGLFIGRSAWNVEGYIDIVQSVIKHLGGSS